MDSLFTDLAKLMEQDVVIDTSKIYKNHEELLEAINDRVSELMDREPGLLFSYLYRLDVSELKIKQVLNYDEDASRSIAKLILDRQLSRVKTKKKIKQDPIHGWDW